MKLRITEAQAKRLSLLKEASNPYEAVLEYSKTATEKLDFIYNKVKQTTIEDILSGGVNIDGLRDMVDEIESGIKPLYSRGYEYINNLPEEGLDANLDDADWIVSDKASALTIILNQMDNLHELNLKHKLSKSFKDDTLDIS
jgi:hypothetical protein